MLNNFFWNLRYKFPFRQLSDLKWWFYHRFHPRHRYNIVKTGLPPGYYDTDTVLLHAMFSLLIRHIDIEREGIIGVKSSLKYWKKEFQDYLELVEKNLPNPYGFGAEFYKDYINFYQSLESLYNWWTLERPAFEKKMEIVLHKDKEYKEYIDLEKEMIDKDTEMLKLLVEIRQGLWT